MAFLFGLFALARHIALLLWRTRMVQTGIQRAFAGYPVLMGKGELLVSRITRSEEQHRADANA